MVWRPSIEASLFVLFVLRITSSLEISSTTTVRGNWSMGWRYPGIKYSEWTKLYMLGAPAEHIKRDGTQSSYNSVSSIEAIICTSRVTSLSASLTSNLSSPSVVTLEIHSLCCRRHDGHSFPRADHPFEGPLLDWSTELGASVVSGKSISPRPLLLVEGKAPQFSISQFLSLWGGTHIVPTAQKHSQIHPARVSLPPCFE